jgi:hypothetical protein
VAIIDTPVAIAVIAIRPSIIDRRRRRRGYIDRPRGEHTTHDGSNTEPSETGANSSPISRLRWSWKS